MVEVGEPVVLSASRRCDRREKISHHATEAARRALEMARVAPEEVDMILLCTSTPDDVFGSATTVQAGLGANKAVAMDLTAACSGFVLGLITAGAYVRSGMAKNVLLVGADCLTRFVDWNDRGTCILFGDGAGGPRRSWRAGGP